MKGEWQWGEHEEITRCKHLNLEEINFRALKYCWSYQAEHWGKQQMQITMETSLGHREVNTEAELLHDSKAAPSCKGMLLDSLQKQNIHLDFLSTHHPASNRATTNY